MNPQAELAQSIAALNLELAPETQQKMLDYLALLKKWNAVYNLTAVAQTEWVSNHLLDSLAVLPYLWEGRWLDVGCGAGLPGLVLAMACPEWEFTLLDSNSKKTSFVKQAIIELGLRNAVVCCARAEDWKANEKFDGIISRAFAEVSAFTIATRHLLAAGGRWAAMKGKPEKELQHLPAGVAVEKIVSLDVPGIEAARSLVILKATGGEH